ncbi:MAG: prfC [Chlamydiales bacterium]|nr:prfC [Chlamydiales bacterium]
MNRDDQPLRQAILQRRTFAIISHPDAGKTTLTEKLLLYSGHIHTAGMVHARKGRRGATSDWMSMEQERGISITASAMQFPYKGRVINVLDTPGHEDFSEDTYRTLTAADCVIMVIDAAKGIEKQTRKLFEVCHLRKIPIFTFINKMDMPGRDPLDLMHEVEQVLGIQAYAWNWPIGSGRDLLGVVDQQKQEAIFFQKVSVGGSQKAAFSTLPVLSEESQKIMGPSLFQQVKDELDLLSMAGNAFDFDLFLKGEVTPVFFGSALTNYGIETLFDTFVELAPPPQPCQVNLPNGEEKTIDPAETPFSAYVFKLQANMDRKHRDNMAFLRIRSGRFEKDITVKNQRTQREVRLSRPHGMVAGERMTLDEAYAGDIIGVVNPGVFAIGDTITLQGNFQFKPLPQFQPEIFARVRPTDIGKRKAFDKGITQLTEEGTIQLLHPLDGSFDAIFAGVGQLQFDVMQYRLKDEYGVETSLTPLSYQCSAWLLGDLQTFKKTSQSLLVKDRLGRPLVLFTGQWEKQYTIEQNPEHQLVDMLS